MWLWQRLHRSLLQVRTRTESSVRSASDCLTMKLANLTVSLAYGLVNMPDLLRAALRWGHDMLELSLLDWLVHVLSHANRCADWCMHVVVRTGCIRLAHQPSRFCFVFVVVDFVLCSIALPC
jgi:hypothetical protein